MGLFRKFFSYFKNADWIILGVVFLLVCFGLVTIYGIASAADSPNFALFKKQVVFACIGFCVLVFMSLVNYKSFSSYSKHIYIIGVFFLVLVLIFGQTVRGTRGWFQIAGFGIQPVELAKLALIIIMAKFFSQHSRQMNEFRYLAASMVYMMIFAGLVLMQPDFGSALTMVGIWVLMVLVIGIKRLHFVLLSLSATAVIIGSWFFVLKDYQIDRIMVFLDPSRDPLGRGYNITQATIAVGSGQWFGRGLGYGSQSQLKFLPESQTDFIFAVIAEEFGFIGIIIIMLLLGVLFWRFMRAAKLCENDFGTFLVLGVAILFFIQIMVNVGMNVGLMPVTGISLPFISYGGSFLIMALLMVGMVQSVVIRR